MENEARGILGGKAYDRLKWIVMIVLPACSVLYLGLATLWNLPAAQQVAGSIALVTTFLGTLIGISTRQYNARDLADGQILVTEVEDGKTMSLRLEKTPDELAGMKRVSFKVVHQD